MLPSRAGLMLAILGLAHPDPKAHTAEVDRRNAPPAATTAVRTRAPPRLFIGAAAHPSLTILDPFVIICPLPDLAVLAHVPSVPEAGSAWVVAKDACGSLGLHGENPPTIGCGLVWGEQVELTRDADLTMDGVGAAADSRILSALCRDRVSPATHGEAGTWATARASRGGGPGWRHKMARQTPRSRSVLVKLGHRRN